MKKLLLVLSLLLIISGCGKQVDSDIKTELETVDLRGSQKEVGSGSISESGSGAANDKEDSAVDVDLAEAQAQMAKSQPPVDNAKSSDSTKTSGDSTNKDSDSLPMNKGSNVNKDNKNPLDPDKPVVDESAKPEAPNSRPLKSFSTVTTDGETVDSDIISGNNHTLIYAWATWSDVGTADLAKMNELYSKYSNDIEFLGIVLDLSDNSAKAKAVLSEKDVKFLNVGGTVELIGLFPGISDMPAVIIVDSNGNIEYDLIPGTQDVSVYSRAIDKVLLE